MARIRSVHPSLFTDEAFVSLSDGAQIVFIGLWTEADDFGAFEWKPITLKMRLRPASTAPIEPLLEELIAHERVEKYEHEGRHYGLIRNFTRYQRPKFPKSLHFIPERYRNFNGSTGVITEIRSDDGQPFPRNAEIAPQMEDGGGNRRGGEKKESPPTPPSGGNGHDEKISVSCEERAFSAFLAAYPKRDGANPKKPARQKFLAALKRVPAETLIAAARAYAADIRDRGKGGTEFVAQMTTWLNQERWNDYAPETSASTTRWASPD